MNRLHLAAAIAAAAFASPALAKHGHDNPHQAAGPHGVGGCPPGLAKKNSQCMPPGRYKKLFEVGERVPPGYNGLTRYNALPYEVRRQNGGSLDPRGRYIYDDHYLYRVDPTTMIVRQVLRGVIGS